jgi:hypothetical protein
MSPILELEEQAVESHDAPRLTVEWSPRWQEFLGCIQPALSRSHARLAGEAPFGLVPLRIMIPSYVLEAFVILSFIFIKVKIDELRPYVAPAISSHDVIYYSGDELPRTQDLGGAESGRSGEAGGEEAHHRTQTIKVARGGSLVPQVVDAPNLKLPSSRDAVANLLAIKPDAGPPPAEGLRSTRSVPSLTALVAPAPNVIRDYTRNGVHLDPVVAPAPSVTRDRPLTAPGLNPTLVAPAPDVAGSHTLVAPALAPVIAPAPSVSRDRPLVAPSLDPSIAPPGANVHRDPFRTGPSLSGNIVPPAPAAVSRQLSSAPVHTMDPTVVPPPVSAPERANLRNPKLSLPSPAVVAPPPSTDVTSDMRRLATGSVPDPNKAVVPPPPSPSGSGSFMSSLIGKIFGPTEVVAPPPAAVSANAKNANGSSRPTLSDNVAPPPAGVANDAGGSPRGNRNGASASLGSNVVAPPPSVGLAGGTGTSPRAVAPYVGNASVVPPPPALGGPGGGTSTSGGGAGTSGGRLLADSVVPPPPSVGGGTSATGSGLGRKGPGLGAPLDAGSGLTPPTNGGSGKDSGTVMSSQPGTKLGLPPTATTGSLALSPSGADKPGLGGAGGGTGIGHGNGSGSGMAGAGTGAGKTGAERGSDPNARGGISPAAGPGGAGNVPAGNPPVRGVDISGGSNIVTLPGFGTDPSGNEPSSLPGRSSLKQHGQTIGVTVVSTASSGGALEPYKNLLKGEKYTTYFDTSLGIVVMEFADESDANHSFGRTLTAPVARRSDLPEGLPHARMLVACTLDVSGNIRNPRVLEAGPPQMTATVLAALPSWKFQAATRNNQPVEVTAILGFGIDTNDRF